MSFRTEQESFWAGSFGDEYTDRNKTAQWAANNTALFSRALQRTQGVRSAIEFGANAGLNLVALGRLLPGADLAGVEINATACKQLAEVPRVKAIPASILEYEPDALWDLAFVKGVLIHIDPEQLARVYDLLYAASRRYVFIAEYYNPVPAEIDYRGHSGFLFKRDFAGEMLDRFPDLSLIDYGFVYHRDVFPQDDLTWFLLEKPNQGGAT